MVQIEDYVREYIGPEDRSRRSKSFSLRNKPGERFLLVRDKNIKGGFNIYFELTGPDYLTEKEKEDLCFAIIHYLKPGNFLMMTGDISEEIANEFKRFSRRTKYMEDTGCLRVLRDKTDGHDIFVPILRHI